MCFGHVDGVRDDGAAAASVAGLAEAANGFAGPAQGRSRASHLDGTGPHYRSTDHPKPGSNQDLPEAGGGRVAVWNSGGEAAPQPIPKGMKSPNPKVLGSYTDSLPGQIQSDAPSAFLSYAIEVLNAGGRGAGLSNQVRVPLARTLPPPVDFSAMVSGISRRGCMGRGPLWAFL